MSVVGPNGAGKSTLLRCLAGLMGTEARAVTLQGRALTAWPRRERARQLAWLGQEMPEASEVEAVSVRDTVALGRLPHQGWWSWPAASRSSGDHHTDDHAIQQALLDTDTLALADRRLPSLSGGERQ